MDVQNIIKHRSILISKSVTIGPDYLMPEKYILQEGLTDSGEGTYKKIPVVLLTTDQFVHQIEKYFKKP